MLQGKICVQEPKSTPACRSQAEVQLAQACHCIFLLSLQQHQMINIMQKISNPGGVPVLGLQRVLRSVSQPVLGWNSVAALGETRCHSATNTGAWSRAQGKCYAVTWFLTYITPKFLCLMSGVNIHKRKQIGLISVYCHLLIPSTTFVQKESSRFPLFLPHLVLHWGYCSNAVYKSVLSFPSEILKMLINDLSFQSHLPLHL